jgi:hypothetical protein
MLKCLLIPLLLTFLSSVFLAPEGSPGASEASPGWDPNGVDARLDWDPDGLDASPEPGCGTGKSCSNAGVGWGPWGEPASEPGGDLGWGLDPWG